MKLARVMGQELQQAEADVAKLLLEVKFKD
jgi:hypothetical protein